MPHLEATEILSQSHVFVLCPSCRNTVHSDRMLSECADCGTHYCGLASNDCKAICPNHCDDVHDKFGANVVAPVHDDAHDVSEEQMRREYEQGVKRYLAFGNDAFNA